MDEKVLTPSELDARLCDHRDAIFESHEEVKECLFIATQGSYNYDLQIGTSDVDSRMVIVPTFDDLCRRRATSREYFYKSTNEKTDVKDIRVFFEQLKKQNPSFLQTLFAAKLLPNPIYIDIVSQLCFCREQIAKYDPKRMLIGTSAIMNSKKMKLMGQVEEGAKDKDINKTLYNIFHLAALITTYMADKSYQDCLRCGSEDMRELILKIRLGKTCLSQDLLVDYACKICDKANKEIDVFLEDVEKNVELQESLDSNRETVDNILDELAKTAILRSIERTR